MIRRFLYLGVAESDCFTPVAAPGLLYLSAARYEQYVLLYAETDTVLFDPNRSVIGKTVPFPEGQNWIRIPQIFYYNRPESLEQWMRKSPSKPRFQVTRLKEDCVAPYVFYHYQLQEEERTRKSKYALIGLLGTLLVFYNEDPPVYGEPRAGSLSTKNTPEKGWSQRMKGYFEADWQTAGLLFRQDILWNEPIRA